MVSQKQQGSTQLALIILLVIALFGAIGFIFWQNFINKSTPNNDQQSTSVKSDSTSKNKETSDSSSNTFKIDTVSFNTPKNWYEADVTPNVHLPNSRTFLPGEKLRTIYGDGKEYFYVRVSVYDNVKNLGPEDWFINDAGSTIGGQGVLANHDKESKDKINNYDAYFRNTINSIYEEVHYVISAEGKIVHIEARTYEISKDLPGVGDFKKFEPAIQAIAQSVKIQ